MKATKKQLRFIIVLSKAYNIYTIIIGYIIIDKMNRYNFPTNNL